MCMNETDEPALSFPSLHLVGANLNLGGKAFVVSDRNRVKGYW